MTGDRAELIFVVVCCLLWKAPKFALTLSPFVWKCAERLHTRLYMEHCNGTLHCYLDTPMSYMTMYSHCIQNICVYMYMLSGQQFVDTAYVIQTRHVVQRGARMITKYLPFLDCVHCHICLAISRCGDFCDGHGTKMVSTGGA